MGHKVEADRKLCIGAGQCTIVADLFKLDGEGKVVVLKDGHVPPEQFTEVEDAVLLCPVEALSLISDGDVQ